MDTRFIRNFCIIAHIDHGKSTLADRFLEFTGTVERRNLKEQLLDSMDLERERGITIKASAVELLYKTGGQSYQLNLIDTPGHVDFSYEVQKSLQACEGAVLLVDATQGVQAQTVANAHLADQVKLTIVPALNKVDLVHSRPDEVALEMENSLAIPKEDILKVSAKSGIGVKELLDAVIERIPAPKGDEKKPLRALVFDSVYNDFRGVIVYVRVIDGIIKRGEKIIMLGNRSTYEVLEVGKLKPQMIAHPALGPGEVGYVVCNIKSLTEVKIGDTITTDKEPRASALPGYREPKPMVFCGFYPTNSGDFEHLREALDTLRLNDASFIYEPESSEALGFGFRCGFLGLLHMEIIQERLEREGKIDLVQTAPTVTYEIEMQDGTKRMIRRPSDLPESHMYKSFREPIMKLQVLLPSEYIGAMMQLCTDRRGRYIKTEYLSPERAILYYEMPFAEMIYDFYDKLKSITRGYGSMDYELTHFEEADLVKLRILVHAHEVDALSVILHRNTAEYRGRKILQKLQKEIPRHLFEVALQAAVGGKVIARENIRALAKNVTSKCYGGDITRKRKLLERQKEGKKRMKLVGNVEIPQKAFLSVLSTEE